MYSKKIKKAFTLIELLVWITLITILALWATNLNFNRLNTKQELDIFVNKIKSNYETIRNSSMSWKWVWTDLILPEKWKIEYSLANSWTILNSSLSWSIWTPYNLTPLFKKWFSISQIRCLQLDLSTSTTTNTWTIEFIWSNISLTWSCTTPYKILELTIKNKYEEDILLINALNWLSEIQ